jgi:hypothetical protein
LEGGDLFGTVDSGKKTRTAKRKQTLRPMLIAAYANSGVCKALRIMLDGEVLYAKGLFYQDFLNARISRSRFSRKASSTVK